MEVILKQFTDLYICSDAIRQCHGTQDKTDTPKATPDGQWTTGDKDRSLIHRVGNKHKHGSTLEHLYYTFDISGISRALLQELARHRIASLTVKSSRYTLKELSHEEQFYDRNKSWNGPWTDDDFDFNRAEKYLVMTSDNLVNRASVMALDNLRTIIKKRIPNDDAKFCMPESYKTSLTWSLNARALQNFINLRTHDSALWEIRNLSNMVFETLPEEHKYLFEQFNHIENLENAES